ncbi:MAG TPA: cation:proton antiporter [Solirubrobacteraceae bacterium]|nr:cation:proton antiporter [Solirubrobacteraceae bacterium]
MSFGTLALIGVCGLLGPLASAAAGGRIPTVVGELLAGIAVGRTGLGWLNADDPTLAFLSEVGLAMLMLNVGMNVPLREGSLRASLLGGALRALAVGAVAVGAAALIAPIDGVGHLAVYAVLIASGSAAVVLPVAQERGLAGPHVLAVIAQVTVADIAATLAIPFVLRPDAATSALAGAALVGGCLGVTFVLARALRSMGAVRALRRQGKRRRWAIDLRVSLIVLFGLAWIADRTGAGVLTAGFGAGLLVAAIGGPKRLSTEVLGVAGGLFIPLFFVSLGAELDLRGVVEQPAALELAVALAALTVAVHVCVALATRQRASLGLLASAQLGVPSAVTALGLRERVLRPAEAAAIIAAAIASLAACALGAALLARQPPPA